MLVHLHEVDVHEERLFGVLDGIEIIERGLLHVFVVERDADDALVWAVDVLPVDLELFLGLFARIAGKRALGHLRVHVAQFRVHFREPFGIGVSVGVEVVEATVFHHVIAISVGKRVVGFTQVPLAGEEGLVAGGLEHGGQGPFCCWKPAALALK